MLRLLLVCIVSGGVVAGARWVANTEPSPDDALQASYRKLIEAEARAASLERPRRQVVGPSLTAEVEPPSPEDRRGFAEFLRRKYESCTEEQLFEFAMDARTAYNDEADRIMKPMLDQKMLARDFSAPIRPPESNHRRTASRHLPGGTVSVIIDVDQHPELVALHDEMMWLLDACPEYVAKVRETNPGLAFSH